MAESMETPRVSSQYLDTFTNQTIRLIGKVIQLRGDEATIDSQGNVTAKLNRDSHLAVGSAVEIIGKVNQDLSVKVLQSTDMGGNFDTPPPTLARKSSLKKSVSFDLPEHTISDDEDGMRRRSKRDGVRGVVREVEAKPEERGRSVDVDRLSRQFHYLQMNEGGRWRVVRPK